MMVKFGGPLPVTSRVTVWFIVSPPPKALTTNGYVPTGIVAGTVMVMVELPAPGAAIVAGLKLTVTPWGKPTAVGVMALLKPPATVVEIVAVPCEPSATASVPGAMLASKLGAALPLVNCSVQAFWVRSFKIVMVSREGK